MTKQEKERTWADDMRAARSGDARAYERLLTDIARALRSVVRRKLAALRLNAEEVEDVVQEALLAIHTKRHTWDEERPILPWVHAIARHKLLDAARRQLRHRRIIVDVPVEDFAEVLVARDDGHDRIGVDVDRHLNSLPERQRGVVRALAVDGSSIAEAAARFEISRGAVRVALCRGLSALRARLSETAR